MGDRKVPQDFHDRPSRSRSASRQWRPLSRNSWRAFEHAVKLGYAYLETDAHATSDGVLVAFDKKLDRVTDRTERSPRCLPVRWLRPDRWCREAIPLPRIRSALA